MRQIFKVLWCALLLSAAAAQADAPAARRVLTPEDFYRLQTVGSPDVSPDGKWVVYTVSVNDKDSNQSRTQIELVSWDGKEQFALTNPAYGTHAPKFSPDGKFVAFIATPAGGAHAQLMLLDRRGGESRALTATSDSIGDYVWSPDGRKLVLVIEASGEEAPGAAASKPGGATQPLPKPIVIDSLHFKEDGDGYLGNGHGQHLFLLDIESKALDPLTNDSSFNEDSPVFSKDGRSLAFIRTHEKGPDADGRYDLDVLTLGSSDLPRTLARIYRAGSQQLAWSPDGSGIAYLEGLEPKYEAYAQSRLMWIPVSGGNAKNLSASLDRAVSSFVFARDGASLQMSVEDDGASYIASVNLRDGSIAPVARGRFVATSLTEGGGHIAVQYADPTSLREIYALDAGQLRKLTSHNEEFLKEVSVGTRQDLHFKTHDGSEIRGYAILPPDWIAGRRYPAILWIHGGPNGQDDDSLAGGQYQRHLLAASGYVVVGINYRGSSGRGSAFAKSILADWGHREVEDILAAADHVVAIGLADPKHLGIGGWSYGGILTDYTIATDGRFKAAFSGAGSANQISMYGTDQYVLQYNNELGPPWKSESLWLKLSYPFFHADRIHTPTMFMGGLLDFNVPVAGGEQMYQALRTLGVPTQLVVYPGEHHGFTKPSFLIDRAERLVAWYDRYLK